MKKSVLITGIFYIPDFQEKKDGLIGLTDTRKSGSGRPLKRELTMAEIVERQTARIELLEGGSGHVKKARSDGKEATKRKLKTKHK